MQLENGKTYRTREGRKVGPMVGYDGRFWQESLGLTKDPEWREDGSHNTEPRFGMTSADDLVSEWADNREVAGNDYESGGDWTSASSWRISSQKVDMGCIDETQRARVELCRAPETNLEQVTIYLGSRCQGAGECTSVEHTTHSITFVLIDGNPDPASIRMDVL